MFEVKVNDQCQILELARAKIGRSNLHHKCGSGNPGTLFVVVIVGFSLIRILYHLITRKQRSHETQNSTLVNKKKCMNCFISYRSILYIKYDPNVARL